MNQTKKILAFIAIDIACFLTILDSTIVNVSLPGMASHFHTSMTGISWVSTAYLIAFSSLLINFSKIADIYGRKKLFLIGLILFGLASSLCGLADSLALLILFRVLQGIGAAILTPLTIPLGIELFGKNAMAKLSVIVGLTISLSAALGPVMGGILNEFFSYRAIFYVNIPFIILALIFGALYLQECFDETIEKRVDYIGCLLLTLSMGTLTFFLVKGNEYGWTSPAIISLILISLISMILFILTEVKSRNPMIDFHLFKVKSYTSSIILISVFFFAYMPVSYLINFYFENTLGYSVLKAGLLMGIPSLTALLVTPLMPLMSKYLSTRTVSFLTVLLAVSGNLLLSKMNINNYMVIIVITFIILGVGIRVSTILYQTAYEEISKDKNGIASGIQNSLRQLTACIAIALVSTLSSHFTETAIVETKSAMMQDINDSQLLATTTKEMFLTGLQNYSSNTASTESTSFLDIKKMISTLLDKKEADIIKNMNIEQQNALKTDFEQQKKELFRILDHSESMKEEQVYHVYNKCFTITGLIALAGILIVPFNTYRKNESPTDELISYPITEGV